MSTLVLPSWVVPAIDAVLECERVVRRRLELGPFRSTTRDAGVAAALAWLTLGEVSPMTARFGGGVAQGSTWTSSATWEMARAESWVALCSAAGEAPPVDEDWRRLGVEPAPPVSDDQEFAYGAWRALAWLLGVREDFPTYTSWHRSAGLPPDRPHLNGPLRGGEPAPTWWVAEQASQDQAQHDARRHWEHVRARINATA